MITDASSVWSKEQYLQAFEASEDKSVAAFARLHGIEADLMYGWLRTRAMPAQRRRVMLTPAEKDLLVELAQELGYPTPARVRLAWRELRQLDSYDLCPSESAISKLLKARAWLADSSCPQAPVPKTFKRLEPARPQPAMTPEQLQEQRLALKTTRYQPRQRVGPQAELGQRYPSDLTHQQWEQIQPHLLKSNGRRIDRARDKINAMFYLVRTGCQWRYLPTDFPNWKTVYSLFRDMSHDGRWEKVNDALRRMDRREAGREEESTLVITDTQSVKTGEKGGCADMTRTRRPGDASVC